MISGAANISRGWPAIHVIKLDSQQKVSVKSPVERTADDVVLSAVQNPPRIGQTLPISALLPDVLARYGLSPSAAAKNEIESSIDVSA